MQYNLFGVHFVDARFGWVIGLDGTLLHTTDGGMNWVQQQDFGELWLDDIFFADHHHGWIVGVDGTIMRTGDGGNTWERQQSNTTNFLDNVFSLTRTKAGL